MEEKTYYLADTEFTSGEGTVYTEFLGEIAIRQVSIINGVSYSSSSVQDWNENVGYLLYDGKKSELDLTHSECITKEQFESVWNKDIFQQS